jgi:hypothetical protein
VKNGERKRKVGRAVQIVLAERHKEGNLLNAMRP